MYRGRFESRPNTVKSKKTSIRPKKQKRLMLLMLSLVLLLSIVGSTTLAYLAADSQEVNNTFVPASVTCEVGNDNKVTNTGNVDAYIRAAVVVNWMDGDGNVWAIDPVKDTDYTITIGSDWEPHGQYYYHKGDVTSQDTTDTPVCTVTLNDGITPPAGFTLVTEVLAEAIQAEGVKDGTSTAAVMDAWGVQP